jgi:hypothetical protein
MKKLTYALLAGLLAVLLVASTNRNAPMPGFENGTPNIQSINALAFGPDGILFIGDSKSATVFAVDTKDKVAVDKAPEVDLKNFDQKVASLLGTDVKNISIQDIAVNPTSKKIYCAIQNETGMPVLLAVSGDKIEAVSLKEVSYSVATLNDAPAEDAKDQRGRPLRVWAISDMSYANGKVLVSGLSNQEFSSTFRTIPFPFVSKQDQASLEIYHAAHGRYETYAPIKTFTTTTLNGKGYLVASYTCTPLVLFPLDELKGGTHVKGRTVGEFGAGNTPLDIVSITKGDESVLVMANSSRPVMRIRQKNLEKYAGSLTEPISESFATAGVDFVTLPMVNVQQMDKLDDTQVVLLQRKSNGDLDLWSSGDRWF